MHVIKFASTSIAVRIHNDQVRRFGGASGLRDGGLLDSALHMPAAQFGGEFLHATIYETAAAYGFHICKNHPFIDGNNELLTM